MQQIKHEFFLFRRTPHTMWWRTTASTLLTSVATDGESVARWGFQIYCPFTMILSVSDISIANSVSLRYWLITTSSIVQPYWPWFWKSQILLTDYIFSLIDLLAGGNLSVSLIYCYRTQVNLGSDLWVRMSVCLSVSKSCFWNLTKLNWCYSGWWRYQVNTNW